MIKNSTMIRYLSDEQYFEKLMNRLEKEDEGLTGMWLTTDKNEALSGTYEKIELNRKDKKIYFSLSGSPVCIAAYAGNTRMVEYFIENDLLEDLPKYDYIDDEEGYNAIFHPEINFYMVTETEETFSEYAEHFVNLRPISFTLPGGKLECFKLLTKAGQYCDFRDRNNFKLLSMCKSKEFWEYLISSETLDRSLLLMAADYAYHYRNVETAKWLIKRYGLL